MPAILYVTACSCSVHLVSRAGWYDHLLATASASYFNFVCFSMLLFVFIIYKTVASARTSPINFCIRFN